MFSLINSTILFSLFALGLPLLIHFLNRQKRQRIPYSSIRFLKFLEKQRIRRLSLYQYLLILIRTLIILMLILAFARPVYDNTANAVDARSAITAVVILDNGLSMRGFDSGTRKFDQALASLNDILSAYAAGDKIFVLTTADRMIMPLDSVQKSALECRYNAPDFAEAWGIAQIEIRKNPNFIKEIHVISDFTSPQRAFYDHCRTDKEVAYYFHRIGSGAINNISIDSLALSNQIIEQDKNVAVTAFIQNRSPFSHEDVGVHIYSLDKRLAYQNISLEPFEKKAVPFKFRPPDAGLWAGYIEIPEDDLTEDNRFYFSFYVPQKIEVLFVDDRPSVYIRSALQSIEGTTDIAFVNDQFASWGRQILSGFDIIMLSGPPAIALPIRQRLAQFVEDGGGLIIIPGDESTTESLRGLSKAFKPVFDVGSLVRTESPENFITLQPPAPGDPLFRDIFRNSDAGYALPKFYQYYQLQPGSAAGQVLRFRNLDPFFISGSYHGGFIGIFAAYFDNPWTDFQFKGIFAPFISRLIYLGVTHTSNRVTWIKSGEDITVELISFSGSAFQLAPPDQEAYQIIPGRKANALTFPLSDLIDPGNYYLTSEEKNVHIISVNVENAVPAGPDDGPAAVASEHIHQIDADTPLAAQLDQFRRGIELTPLFFIFAILLFLVELILVKLIEGKKGSAVAHARA